MATHEKQTFHTDRELKALKPKAKHYDVWDGVQRGLAVRVGPRNSDGSFRRTFVVVARFNGKHPTRRAIGEYPGVSLAEAREKAADWRKLVKKGKDPKREEERARREELRKQKTTFESVTEAFSTTVLCHQRKGNVVERQLRREFIPRWGDRPIDDITPLDVFDLIRDVVKRGAVHEAHNLLGVIRRLYTWAINCGAYGLESSPCDRLRPKDVVGVGKTIRKRVLNDPELRALWRATEPAHMAYPFGPMYRLLAITGQRKSEVAEARWDEFDLEEKLWEIPADRMKADAPHVVPLCNLALQVLESLPKFDRGTYLFSTTFGVKPVSGFSKAKTRLDASMREQLGTLEPFVVHDIRRTVRTRLSAAPVENHVRELVIGHQQQGLHKVYDQHAYLEEKRLALDWWAAKLRDIVEPAPANVVHLGRATA
jgi:integrase